MLRLWKETRDELYLNLSYLCLANVFNNMWLWECEYGYAEHYRTFFALFPLKEAPYTAVYEEIEGFAAFHDYLSHYEGDAPEWLKILTAEFTRLMIYKASFYYPPNLPQEILSEEPKTGEIDPKLWIPLEDIHDGWEKAGQVGQEVYGSGLPFGIVPRHYWRIPGEKFMVYIEYPTKDFSAEAEEQVTFQVLGDPRLACRLRIMPVTGRKRMQEFTVQTEYQGRTETLKGKKTEEGHIEYKLLGDRLVTVRWAAARRSIRNRNGRENGKKG
jgi:hypothetical protein